MNMVGEATARKRSSREEAAAEAAVEAAAEAAAEAAGEARASVGAVGAVGAVGPTVASRRRWLTETEGNYRDGPAGHEAWRVEAEDWGEIDHISFCGQSLIPIICVFSQN